MPKNAGKITDAGITFDGNPSFFGNCSLKLTAHGKKAVVTAQHSYDKAGTYFATVRVKAARRGSGEDKYVQVQNIAMVRIVVK